MRAFVLACHIFVTLCMIVVVLLQKSESSLGLGGGTMGGMMTARGTATLLTRLTAVLAFLFMLFSLWLTVLARGQVEREKLLTGSAVSSSGSEQSAGKAKSN